MKSGILGSMFEFTRRFAQRGRAPLVLFVAAAVIAIAGACSEKDVSEPGPLRPDSVVSMPGFSFTPFTLTVRTGQTVIYDFPAEPHNVIFTKLTGAPQDIQVATNRRVSRRFDTAGSFPYDCTIHPGMSGMIVVEQ
jgi:plastocyanin